MEDPGISQVMITTPHFNHVAYDFEQAYTIVGIFPSGSLPKLFGNLYPHPLLKYFLNKFFRVLLHAIPNPLLVSKAYTITWEPNYATSYINTL